MTVGQLQTNCYLVIDGNKALIIDPGDDAEYIIQILADEDTTPTKIIATHGHYDHLLAVYELKLAYNVPFLMHKDDGFLLKRMGSSASYFSGIPADPSPKIGKYLKDGDKLTINHQSLTIMKTPGHTPGSISLYSRKAKCVFVGDLIFAGAGFGRTDFSYSNHFSLLKSIRKLLSLPEETKVFSGHGEQTTIGALRKIFLTSVV